MAAVAPSAEQDTGLLQKLSLNSKSKTQDLPEVNKKHPGDNKKEVPNMSKPWHGRFVTPKLPNFMDQSAQFIRNGYGPPTYYYGGFEGSNEWECYSRHVNPNGGFEMPHNGVYGDIYHNGFGYGPYSAYQANCLMPTMGHDGQLYGLQEYHFPGPYYPLPTSSAYTPTQPPTTQGEVSISVATEESSPLGDTASTNTNGAVNANTSGSNGSVTKCGQQNSTITVNDNHPKGSLPGGLISCGYPNPRFDGVRTPAPWIDGSFFHDKHHKLSTNSSSSTTGLHASNSASIKNQNLRPQSHFMGLHTPRPVSGMGAAVPGYINRLYPDNRFYGQYSNTFKAGIGFGSSGFDSKANGQGWLAMDNKYKPRGRGNGYYGYGNITMEGLNELNRGPRSGCFKSNKNIGANTAVAVNGQNLTSNANNENSYVVPDRDQYNHPDFPEKYSEAKIFIIKSFSEDDIHKSIKYNVWASTPNGNKRLDGAFQEAQEKAGGCPVFLFFSVNTSGQFVGVAEMIGLVDFNKTLDYWQRDKWNGCFPVKWHIVKDVPNSLFKHITLENNENKPVTNSRDTQEVKLDQGLQMLKLFKDQVSKTSILDDFGFYEVRQKSMQEGRVKQQFQKQVWDGKAATAVEEKEKNVANVNLNLDKPSHFPSVLTNRTGEGGSSRGKVA